MARQGIYVRAIRVLAALTRSLRLVQYVAQGTATTLHDWSDDASFALSLFFSLGGMSI